MSGVLIIGASHAGVATAAALRSASYGGYITLVAAEAVLPYHRPPLSKDAFSKDDYVPAPLRPASFYANSKIDLKQSVRIASVDTANRTALASDGTVYPYESLVIACGAEPRRLPTSIDPEGLALYLRTHDDFTKLKLRLASAKSIAIIGGGLIGLEIAATALHKGLRTTVIEAGNRLMERTLSKSVANYVLDRHEAKGLKARFGAVVAGIRRDAAQEIDLVTLGSGETIEADIVVAAIGAVPHDGLARDAGLRTDNGIVVSDEGRTSDAHVYAVGDCAAWFDPELRRHVRNEAVNPGQDQAKAVAAAITGGEAPARRLPRYWSHQAAIQIQMAGEVNGTDMEAVLNAPASGAFSVLGFKANHLVAIQTINAPQQFGKLHDMIGMEREALAAALDVEFPPPHHH